MEICEWREFLCFFLKLFFKKVLIRHSEPATAGEESINSRHFPINSWIFTLRCTHSQNDELWRFV